MAEGIIRKPYTDGYSNILLDDCNNAIDTQRNYYADGSTLNRPTNSKWWHIRCFGTNGANFISQVAILMNAEVPEIYVRDKYVQSGSSVWGNWTKVSTSS